MKTDKSLRPGDECQLCDLVAGDRFQHIGGGDKIHKLKQFSGEFADVDTNAVFMAATKVLFVGRDEDATAKAPRILKGSELLIGDVVEYVAGDTGPGPATVDAFNLLAPFAVLVTPELTGANARCNKQKPWRYEPDDCFRLLSRLDPKPEFPRQGTRSDLVPGMRYRVDHDTQECVCVAVSHHGGYYKYRATVANYEQISSLALGGEITLLGIDPGFKDQAAETTIQGVKVVDVKVTPAPSRPSCEDCLKPHTFAAGYGTLVELGLKGEWLCGDCAGMRTPLKPMPQQKPRKLAPYEAYHLNDVGGNEGPGWRE